MKNETVGRSVNHCSWRRTSIWRSAIRDSTIARRP